MSAFPAGHFYSPVVDLDEALADERRIWPEEPPHLPGVDLALDRQRAFLEDHVAAVLPDYDYPATEADRTAEYAFHRRNGRFENMDPLALFTVLRTVRPSRMIEVGSGFSSLLTADVNRRFLDGSLSFTCIEPYPRPFLVAGVPGIESLEVSRVQDVGVAMFEELGEGDILFIDSSHVSKTGSDVNFLFLEVIPRLRPGVFVHVHDVFLPFDYPRRWVVDEVRSWNEQYLLQALLTYSTAFDVRYGSTSAAALLGDVVEAVCGERLGGGSFWIQAAPVREENGA